MPSTAEVKERPRGDVDAVGTNAAVLFELESVAISGRQITYDVLRKALSEKKVDFTPAQFSRYCLYPTISCYLNELLEALVSANAQQTLKDEISTRLFSKLGSGSVELNPGLNKVLQAAQSMNIPAATISALPEELAVTLAEKLGFTERGIKLFTFKNVEKNFPRADFWLKVSKGMGRSPRSCIVVASGMAGCKSALSAGMRCVVVSDQFTGHQDFGGADVILDSWDELNAKEVLKSLVSEPS